MPSSDKFLQRLAFGLTFPLVILNGWVAIKTLQFFQPLASIAIAASILAFLLNYLVDFLVSRGVPRSRAGIAVFLLAVSILAAIGLGVVPIALSQLSELAKRLPSWLDSGARQLQALQLWAQDQNIPVDFSGIALQLTGKLSGELQNLTGKILSFALDTASSLVNLLLTLVFTFYLLLQGEQIWGGIFQWFPVKLGNQLRQSLKLNFQNYYIGQATIATLSGVIITLAFLLLNVPFGILFGLGIGVMGLIPFAGAVTVSTIALLVSLESFWLGVKVLVIVILIDQAINNVVAPRILGELTGLNPVWILVSLILGLKFFGPLGLVVAVPVACSVKSIAESLREVKAIEAPDAPEVLMGAGAGKTRT